MVSTQGRVVLDPGQPDAAAPTQARGADHRRQLLFTPREAIRTTGGAARRARRRIAVSADGAAIDYYLGRRSPATSRWKSWTPPARWSANSPAPRPRPRSARPTTTRRRRRRRRRRPAAQPRRRAPGQDPGMHRFTWDLRYPGPWQSAARPEGPNGPAAVPGKYSVRLTVGSWTATQPLHLIEDPRIAKDGVTDGRPARAVRPQPQGARPGERREQDWWRGCAPREAQYQGPGQTGHAERSGRRT